MTVKLNPKLRNNKKWYNYSKYTYEYSQKKKNYLHIRKNEIVHTESLGHKHIFSTISFFGPTNKNVKNHKNICLTRNLYYSNMYIFLI